MKSRKVRGWAFVHRGFKCPVACLFPFTERLAVECSIDKVGFSALAYSKPNSSYEGTFRHLSICSWQDVGCCLTVVCCLRHIRGFGHKATPAVEPGCHKWSPSFRWGLAHLKKCQEVYSGAVFPPRSKLQELQRPMRSSWATYGPGHGVYISIHG